MKHWPTWLAAAGCVFVSVLIAFGVHSAHGITGRAVADQPAAAQYRVSGTVIGACRLLDHDPANAATAIAVYAENGALDAEVRMIAALRRQADAIADAIVAVAAPTVSSHLIDPFAPLPDTGFADVVLHLHDVMAGVAQYGRALANDFEAALQGRPFGDIELDWSRYYQTFNAAHTLCHEFYHR